MLVSRLDGPSDFPSIHFLLSTFFPFTHDFHSASHVSMTWS